MASEPASDDFKHGGEHLRSDRERAGMSRAELAARARNDSLDPRPYIDEAWITRVEADSGVQDVTFAEWMTLGRSLQPPRPDWWEEGYEHDLRFAWSGHREPVTESGRQYWARVRTVAAEGRWGYAALPDPDQALHVVCELLNAYRVAYLLVGGVAALGYEADIQTQDIDLTPRTDPENLRRLCEALNVLGPRWPWSDRPEGRRIDGGRLEPRHFSADSVVVELVTRLGAIDVVLRPRGFEQGYEALEPRAVTRLRGGVELHLASLDDVIRSKELLDRPKDREQLPAMRRRRAELRRLGEVQ
jgi:hypothetical protein